MTKRIKRYQKKNFNYSNKFFSLIKNNFNVYINIKCILSLITLTCQS